MSQHDYQLDNQSGSSFRADINNALSAIVSLNSGSSSPSPSFAFQLWVDTSTSQLKIRNSTNTDWLLVGNLTSENLGLLPLDGSLEMTGTLDMGGNLITGIGDPSSDQDAAHKSYVDNKFAHTLYLTGGTMLGVINMGNYKISNLAAPSSDQDAATKKYVDDHAGGGGSYTPIDSQISGTTIDWSVGDTYWKEISTNTTFTFSNQISGKTISVIIKNTNTSEITVTFPSCLSSGILPTIISPGKETLFTFTRSNGKIYAGALTDMA